MTWQPAGSAPQNLLLQPMERRVRALINHVARAATLLAAERKRICKWRRWPCARPTAFLLIYSLFPNLRQDAHPPPAGDRTKALSASWRLVVRWRRSRRCDPRRTDNGRTALDRHRHRQQRDPQARRHQVGHDHFAGRHQLPFMRRVADRFVCSIAKRTVAHGALAQLDEALIGAGLAGECSG